MTFRDYTTVAQCKLVTEKWYQLYDMASRGEPCIFHQMLQYLHQKKRFGFVITQNIEDFELKVNIPESLVVQIHRSLSLGFCTNSGASHTVEASEFFQNGPPNGHVACSHCLKPSVSSKGRSITCAAPGMVRPGYFMYEDPIFGTLY